MKVIILPEIHAQIMYYVHKSNIEISGLGRIEKDSNGNMVVTKVYLLEQENTGASTDIDAQAVAKLMYQTREDKGNLNFWWHSHVNMATFWSGTDMATIKQFGRNGYLLSTVFNKKGEFRTSYFQGATDFLPEIFVDQIETQFNYVPRTEETSVWEKEYETKCKAKVWTPPANGYHANAYGKTKDYWNNGYYNDDDDWYDDDYGQYTFNKMTKAKKGKKTLLTEDKTTENLSLVELDLEECGKWLDLYAELKGVNVENVEADNLTNFYKAWKGDYNSAYNFVLNKLDTQSKMDNMKGVKHV